ncbi:MAG: glucose 1-dehydrogenase [Anaerolineales bacterium]|nr:glucose 1-dehydrogenase [Anaerolineales bacterium]
MPSFDLSHKVAIVTGSSRGIGEAIARAYAAAGAQVVIVSRTLESAQPVAAAITAAGGTALAVACHTGRHEQVTALVQTVQDKLGQVDILVNNAATNPHFGPLLEASDEVWQKTLQTNVLGYLWLAQAAAPGMLARGAGKIINISSVAGLKPGTQMGVYSVTKAAILMLTQVLAAELGPRGVQVNAIAPGVIQTKFSTPLWSNPALAAGVQGRAGRIGQPEDVAGAALFLASPAADYVNGETLIVDGGLSTTGGL